MLTLSYHNGINVRLSVNHYSFSFGCRAPNLSGDLRGSRAGVTGGTYLAFFWHIWRIKTYTGNSKKGWGRGIQGEVGSGAFKGPPSPPPPQIEKWGCGPVNHGKNKHTFWTPVPYPEIL